MNPESQACLDVSGIVVYAAPGSATHVRDALECVDGVTVHAVSAEGKIVATVETGSEACSTERFAAIRALRGVLDVAMVYHQIETDPDQEV